MEPPVTSLPLPLAQPDAPLGIVIRTGVAVKQATVIWAYVWADDVEGSEHWHQGLPAERVA